jgi:hypothetical protein
MVSIAARTAALSARAPMTFGSPVTKLGSSQVAGSSRAPRLSAHRAHSTTCVWCSRRHFPKQDVVDGLDAKDHELRRPHGVALAREPVERLVEDALGVRFVVFVHRAFLRGWDCGSA